MNSTDLIGSVKPEDDSQDNQALVEECKEAADQAEVSTETRPNQANMTQIEPAKGESSEPINADQPGELQDVDMLNEEADCDH